MSTPPLAIGRLHARATLREPVVARLAAETLAAEVAAALPPLPPQAVLLLRRLALALPLHALEHLPDARLRLHVATAARSAIAHAAKHAARPALGAVAAEVEAVWFGDQAELLACLARDGLASRLDSWWWRQLLGRAHPDWLAAWTARPAAAPAALRLLERGGLLPAVLAALAAQGALRPVTEQTAAAQAVDEADAVPPPPRRSKRPDAGAAAPAPEAAPSAMAPQPGNTIAARPRREPGLATGPRPAPFVAEAPDTDRTGYAQTIPANPAKVRSEPLSQPHKHASVALRTAGNGGRLPAPAAAGQSAAQPDAAPVASAASPASGPWQTGHDAAHRSESKTSNHQATPAASLARQALRLLQNDAVALPAQPHTGSGAGADAGFCALAHTPPPAVGFADSGLDGAVAPLDAAPQVLITRYGRLLFLVNLLLGDGLYPDFTRPLDPAFPLPLWRLLMLLGLGLVGPALRDDPLWRLLDRLANDAPLRDALPSTERQEALEHWPVPAPQRVPPTRPLRSLPARRQRATHTKRPKTGQHRVASGLAASPAPQRLRLRREPAASLARWLACYRVSLRSRLAPALGVGPALVGRAFVSGPAPLWVSEADIVVVMPLDAHPLAWRLTGLDRDPGPLPDVGRALRFVFE